MEIFMAYVLPVLIVMVLAAVLGFVLAFFGIKFEVKRNPRIDKVKALLPGINCGGCGYPGCEAFAEALVRGEIQVDKCRPSKKPARESINRVLTEAV